MSRKWFHPQLVGKDAENMLINSIPGSFLVRRSGSSPGDFTLGVRLKDIVTHVKIRSTGDYFDLYGGEKFATLTELVDFYTENPEQLVETNGNVINLQFPIVCEQDTPTDRWFHGQLSGTDATQLLMSQGSDGSYLVRESERYPGSFTLSVRCGNRVTHVKIIYNRRKYELSGVRFNTLSELIDYFVANPMVEVSGGVLLLRQPLQTTRFTLTSLVDRVNELEQMTDADYGRAGFSDEFEMLQQQQSRGPNTRRVGILSENRDKNRFKNILPFDHTRVKLREIDNTQGADYINANYVTDMSGQRCYIAGQGPLPNTVAAFWQMVYENESKIIINTTALVEKSRTKSTLYWPTDADTPLEAGLFTINKIEEIDFDTYVRRGFSIKHTKTGVEKRAYQFHYIDWPDHGVPSNAESVLNFLDEIREFSDKFPGIWTVHCSAGIGRSGTFIAIDMLKNIIESKGKECDLDVQKIVLHMRSERSGMIQTESQYKFVYSALVAQVKGGYRKKVKGKVIVGDALPDEIPDEAQADDIYGSFLDLKRTVAEHIYDNTTHIYENTAKKKEAIYDNKHASEPLYDNNPMQRKGSGSAPQQSLYDNQANIVQQVKRSSLGMSQESESLYDNQANIIQQQHLTGGGPSVMPPQRSSSPSIIPSSGSGNGSDIYDNCSGIAAAQSDDPMVQQLQQKLHSQKISSNNNNNSGSDIYDNQSSVQGIVNRLKITPGASPDGSRRGSGDSIYDNNQFSRPSAPPKQVEDSIYDNGPSVISNMNMMNNNINNNNNNNNNQGEGIYDNNNSVQQLINQQRQQSPKRTARPSNPGWS